MPCSLARRWKEHLLIRKGGRIACLDCGKYGAAVQGSLGKWKRKWLHEPCAGVGKLPKPLVELLFSGAVDFPCVRAKESWVEFRVRSAAVCERLSRRLKDANIQLAH